jgi:hypothetical protein
MSNTFFQAFYLKAEARFIVSAGFLYFKSRCPGPAVLVNPKFVLQEFLLWQGM